MSVRTTARPFSGSFLRTRPPDARFVSFHRALSPAAAVTRSYVGNFGCFFILASKSLTFSLLPRNVIASDRDTHRKRVPIPVLSPTKPSASNSSTPQSLPLPYTQPTLSLFLIPNHLPSLRPHFLSFYTNFLPACHNCKSTRPYNYLTTHTPWITQRSLTTNTREPAVAEAPPHGCPKSDTCKRCPTTPGAESASSPQRRRRPHLDPRLTTRTRRTIAVILTGEVVNNVAAFRTRYSTNNSNSSCNNSHSIRHQYNARL